MPAKREWTTGELAERLERRREQNRQAQRRFRARHADDVSLTNKEVSATPSLSSSPIPCLATQDTPPPVARLTERLVAFGRGYKHDATRLAKLVRDFPHLDVEEEVADALDWLERPANKKRLLSVGFLRKWCAKSEADRVAPPAPKPSSKGATNGHYVQPITQQGRNPGPPDLPLFEAPVQRIDPGEMARFVAGRREVPLKAKLAEKVKEQVR